MVEGTDNYKNGENSSVADFDVLKKEILGQAQGQQSRNNSGTRDNDRAEENEIEINGNDQDDDSSNREKLRRIKLENDELRSQVVELREDLNRTKSSADTNLSKLRYMMADFDNYRKQVEKQVSQKIESGKADLLIKFLNIRDDYIRALETAKQSRAEKVVIEGLEGILKNIDSLFKSEGIIEIESLGTPFDPNIHDAISFAARDDIPENTVTIEIRKGYMMNNKVLRPSMVEISKKIVKNTVNDRKNGEEETD